MKNLFNRLLFAALFLTGSFAANAQTAAPQLSPETKKVDFAVFKDYEGRYEINPLRMHNFIVDVYAEPEKLRVYLSHRQKRDFVFDSADKFVDAETKQIVLLFGRDKNNKVNGIKFANMQMTYYFDDRNNPVSRMIAGKLEMAGKRVELPTPSLAGNTTFELKGFENARIVALAGSFNNWNQSQILMQREGGRWICRIDLQPGKYFYKFVVDGTWTIDPENPKTEADDQNNKNSVLEIVEKQ